MIHADFSTIIEDSHGNKYCFYYSNSAIYCREISSHGDLRDTVIINQANKDFLVGIDENDEIYLACTNRDKGLLVFTLVNKSWRYEQVLTLYGSNIYLMNMFIIDKTIHILYAKRLPLGKFYNIFHLHNDNKGIWVKNNISDIYAENIEQAYSTVISQDGDIHFVNIWYDGSNYQINYNRYDCAVDLWKSINVASLCNSKISIKLLQERESLHLVCHTIEEDVSIIFYFVKRKLDESEFEFVSMDKDKIKITSCIPVFNIENSNLYAAWIDNSNYYELILKTEASEEENKKWNRHVECPIKNFNDLFLLEHIKNDKEKSIISHTGYYLIDEKYNLIKPYKDQPIIKSTKAVPEGESAKKGDNFQREMNQYLLYILAEIKSLSESILLLNEKLNRLEAAKASQIKEYEKNKIEEASLPSSKELQHPKNKTDFKEKFMGRNPTAIKTDATLVFAGARSSTNSGFPSSGGASTIDNTAIGSIAIKPTLNGVQNANEQNTANTTTPIEKGDIFKIESQSSQKTENTNAGTAPPNIAEISNDITLAEDENKGMYIYKEGSLLKKLTEFFK